MKISGKKWQIIDVSKDSPQEIIVEPHSHYCSLQVRGEWISNRYTCKLNSLWYLWSHLPTISLNITYLLSLLFTNVMKMWSLAARLQMWRMAPSLGSHEPLSGLAPLSRPASRLMPPVRPASGPGLTLCRRAEAAENHHWTGKKWQPIKITLRGHDFKET